MVLVCGLQMVVFVLLGCLGSGSFLDFLGSWCGCCRLLGLCAKISNLGNVFGCVLIWWV